jgi:hypothetical protein
VFLIAAFAIFVIITKKLRITRTISITGENARRFGITLLAATIPISMVTGQLIRAISRVVPMPWPFPQALQGVLFGGAVLAIAWHFRNAPVVPEVTEVSQVSTALERPPELSEPTRDDQSV